MAAGEPLDAATSAVRRRGKPRVSIFSIAHLGDAERMFFVSLLLNQIVGWMRHADRHDQPARHHLHGRDRRLLSARRQPAVEGAAVDADEAGARLRHRHRAGHAEPGGPRLQGALERRHLVPRTPADRARQGVASWTAWKERQVGASIGRKPIACCRRWGSACFCSTTFTKKRRRTFQTRWSMSYLRGPLSRDQIRTLMSSRRPAVSAPAATAAAVPARPAVAPAPAASSTPPVVPPGVKQLFVPGAASGDAYQPVALGAARVNYADPKLQVNEARDIVAAAPIGDGAVTVDWTGAEVLDVAPATLPPVLRAMSRLRRCRRRRRRRRTMPPGRSRLPRGSPPRRRSSSGGTLRFSSPRRSANRNATSASACRARSARRATPRSRACARSSPPSGRRWKRSCAGPNRALRASSNRRPAETPDRCLDRRDGHRRAVRSQGNQRRHHRPGDHGGARIRPQREGDGGCSARAGKRRGHATGAGRPRRTDITSRRRTIAARFDSDAANVEKVALAPKRGQVTVEFVSLGWMAK